MKHTPGPWNAAPNDQGQTQAPICTVWDSNVLGYGHVVAYVPVIHCRKNMPYEANAHLIAAAPELLEACKAQLSDGPELDDWGDWAQQKRDMLEQAISKAEGTKE